MENSRDVISQVANFGFLTEGPKCREPHRGNFLYARKCLRSFEKPPVADTHFAAKWTPPTPPDVPLEVVYRLTVTGDSPRGTGQAGTSVGASAVATYLGYPKKYLQSVFERVNADGVGWYIDRLFWNLCEPVSVYKGISVARLREEAKGISKIV